jgi:C-terminal processing protease CtpA/Prc
MKKIISFFLSLTILLTSALYVIADEDTFSTEEINKGYDTTISLIKLLGITDKDEKDILKSAIMTLSKENKETFYKVLDAVAKSVDENSAYYTPSEWESFYSDLSGVTGGIGVIATVVDDYFEVMSTIDGGAAEKAGIVSGDRLIEADGKDLTGKNSLIATNYLKGEIGTTVNVKVLKKH